MIKKILKGIYLVVDPRQERTELFNALQTALAEGLSAVQIYNAWPAELSETAKYRLVNRVADLCRAFEVPCFVNNEHEILKHTTVDGVHFDELPENMEEIRNEIGREFMVGLTCTNDLSVLTKAKEHGVDYLSFCAMFPSASVGDCEIVKPESVMKTLREVNIPVFLSGGITPQNIEQFKGMNISGIAVISGIMQAENPATAVKEYRAELDKILNR